MALSKKAAAAAIGVSLLLIVARVAYSHDIWLSPEQFVLVEGDTLVVHQLIGTELDTERDIPLLRTMTPRFELITAQGTVDLLSELPDPSERAVIEPVLKRELDFEGLALVTMDHAFIYEDWTREQFLETLQHEEFEIERFEPYMGRGEVESERYRRTLKALVQVGSADGGDLHRRVVGQSLEILLLQNPYLLGPGDPIDVQVLYDGEPLPDQMVKVFHQTRRGRVSQFRERTGRDGVARFTLDDRGAWLIRLVHLIPCSEHPDLDCEDDAYWESHWASYTFALN